MTTTPGGFLLVLAVMVPFVGVLAAFALGGRNAQRVATVTILAGAGVAIAIAAAMVQSGESLAYLLGGWAPPLGVALRADSLALVMIPAIAVVILGIGVYARADFGTPSGVREARAPFVFWTLLLAIWGALNLVFVSGDLFTLYVALELLTFAAVPLVSLDGKAETLRAALRYLLYALLGSILYLLGVVLVYGAYGTLDIQLLAERIRPEPAALAAAALMTAGLLAKTALFPLHLWLPPAHAGAPPAASAVLSGLVIKGSWFLVVRLWFDVLPGVVTAPSAQLLAALGAAAILVGNVVALRQERLKLLVAYSTVAQIGYLFLMFPLAFDAGMAALERGGALAGGMLQAISHATAKAAMFMAAGLIYKTLGHDRIAEFAGYRPGVAGERAHLRARRAGADGPAAERRLRREEAAPRRGRRVGAMVVGSRAGRGRAADGELRRAGARPRVVARGGTGQAARARVAPRGDCGAGARDLLAGARARGARPGAARRPAQPARPQGVRLGARRPRRRRRDRARPRASAAAAARRRRRRRVGAPRDGRDRRDVRPRRRGAAAVAGRGTRADRGGDRVRCRDARARLTAEVPWRN